MADFNPAMFISPDNNEAVWAEQRRLTNDATNKSIDNAYATREDNRRHDQEVVTNADNEQRRRTESDRNYGIQSGQLDIMQSQEARNVQEAELKRRQSISKMLFEAGRDVETDDEVDALNKQVGFALGIVAEPDPEYAGSQLKQGELPTAVAPPIEGETVGDGARRIAESAVAIPSAPTPADVLGPARPDEIEPLAAGETAIDVPMNLGVTEGKPPLVSDVISGAYTPEQLQAAHKDFFEGTHKPYGEIEAEASGKQQMAISQSFTKRVQTLQSLRMDPASEQLAIGEAARVHGVPMPPTQQPNMAGMPPPPPGMEPQQPVLDPQVAALAMAPPEVPVSVTDMGRQHGAVRYRDVKTGEVIARVDFLAMKQARRDKMREKWQPLLDSIDNPDDRKKATGAMQTYIETGDPAAKEILHWLFQKDSAALKMSIDPKEQSQIDMAQARLDMSKENQNIRVLEKLQTSSRKVADNFNKQYNVVGFNRDMEGLGKAAGLISGGTDADTMSQRVAAAQTITSLFGKAASNAERTFITSAGLQSQVEEVVNFLTGTAALSSQQISMMKKLNSDLQNYSKKRRVSMARNLQTFLKRDKMTRDWGAKLGWQDADYLQQANDQVSAMFEGNQDPSLQPDAETEEDDNADMEEL